MTMYSAPAGGPWQFNPPPGWPTPEASWVPPPHWRPDPAWPTAPPNWPYWIPVGYLPAGHPAAGGPPGARTTRSRLILATKILAGVLTFAATVIGTWIAVSDRPEPYTFDKWQLAANATCERDFGDVQLSLFAAMSQVAQIAAAPPPLGQPNATMAAAAQSMGQFAAGFRAMSGDLREIQVPDGHDPADINALLEANSKIAETATAIGAFLVNYQVGTTNAAQMQQVLTAMQTMTGTTLPAWVAAAQRLELDQCLAIMGTATTPPSSAPPSAAPSSGATLSTDQQALAGRLNPAVLVNCIPATPVQGASAAVNCATARTGPTKLPLVLQFPDSSSMSGWLAGMSAGLADGRCADGDSAGNWQQNDTTVGTLVCRAYPDGSYHATWTFDDDHIAVVAEAATREAIYTWWTANALVLTR